RLRESHFYPRGIDLMFWVLNDWAFGRDPLSSLAFEEQLASIVLLAKDGNRYFERLIEGNLLANTHRVTMVLKPKQPKKAPRASIDHGLAGRKEFSVAELQNIRAKSTRLRAFQEAPDPPEMLRRLSFLKREDLRRAISATSLQEVVADEGRIFYHTLG